MNDGEDTLRNASVEISYPDIEAAALYIGVDQAHVDAAMPLRWDLPERHWLHPQQAIELSVPIFSVRGAGSLTGGLLHWTVYVEDGPPTGGIIDVAHEISVSAETNTNAPPDLA